MLIFLSTLPVRNFRWPGSEKKPRFFSQTCCGTSHGRVRPSCACATRLCCSACHSLQHNPGPLRKFEPGEKWKVPQHAAAAHSPLPGLQCWQVVELEPTQTTAPTVEAVSRDQERAQAHPGQHPNSHTIIITGVGVACCLAGLSSLARRYLMARPRPELPVVVGKVAAAVRTAGGGGGMSGASENAWLCMLRTACCVPSWHFVSLCGALRAAGRVDIPPPACLFDPSRSYAGGRVVWGATGERNLRFVKNEDLPATYGCAPRRARLRAEASGTYVVRLVSRVHYKSTVERFENPEYAVRTVYVRVGGRDRTTHLRSPGEAFASHAPLAPRMTEIPHVSGETRDVVRDAGQSLH